MKPIALIISLALLASCGTKFPLPRGKTPEPIVFERKDSKVCQAGGKVWTQAADRECKL